ncbi:hypothetical protein [Paenibacillus phytorum]|nr:hypothetical protein [Paenibacillus phytorum]
MLSNVRGGSFFGPNETAYKYSQNTVFSLARRVNVPGIELQTI